MPRARRNLNPTKSSSSSSSLHNPEFDEPNTKTSSQLDCVYDCPVSDTTFKISVIMVKSPIPTKKKSKISRVLHKDNTGNERGHDKIVFSLKTTKQEPCSVKREINASAKTY